MRIHGKDAGEPAFSRIQVSHRVMRQEMVRSRFSFGFCGTTSFAMNRFGSSVFSVLKRQLLLMFCATWLSCSADPLTELVVVINSDMETPDEFDGFRVAVTDHEGALSTERYYFVGKEPGKVVLPADFGLVPKGGDASRKVAVEVWATLAGADLFSNRALTGFVKGKVLRLDMFLASRCLTEAKACKPNETCRVEGCVPEEIDPGSLPEYTPGSQPPATEWIAAIHSSRSSRWWNVALDSAGNSYAAGMFAGEFKAQGVTHTASSLYSAMIASYSPTGKMRWFKALGGNTLSWASSVEVGADDRVCVVGWFDGSVQIESKTLDSGSGQDSFVACYDQKGDLLWVTSFGSHKNVQAKDIAVAPNGDVAVVGVYNAPIVFEGGVTTPTSVNTTDDGFMARFDSSGKIKSYRVLGGTGEADVVWNVAFDSQSNLLMVGTLTKGDVDLGGGVETFSGKITTFLAKYDVDSALLWSHAFPSASFAVLYGVTAGPNDRVAVTGRVEGSVDWGGGPLSVKGQADCAVAVYDATGKHEASVLIGEKGDAKGDDIRFTSDAILIVGAHSGPLSFRGSSLLEASDQNAFVLALSPDLSSVPWAFSLGAEGEDQALGLDTRGKYVLVAGEFKNSLKYKQLSATSQDVGQAFLLQFLPPPITN
jgi:hypothetical protein